MAGLESVGRYRVVQSIGSGAFATVWLAHDDELGVPVAIKLLADNWTQRADVRNRFLSEARILRQVEDEHVVRVYDIGEHDGRPYFVMDYADQGSLADRLAGGPIGVDQAIDWAMQSARALSVLHEFGVVHRDVSPGNLLLRTRRAQSGAGEGSLRLMIADLGMAKALAESSGITMTVGTPAYMAPEQASNTGGFDERADVYALGAVTYNLLAGRPPYNFDSPTALLNRPPTLRPQPIHLVRPDVPAALDEVLARAMAYHADQRWESADAFSQALREVAASAPTPTSATPARMPWSREPSAYDSAYDSAYAGPGPTGESRYESSYTEYGGGLTRAPKGRRSGVLAWIGLVLAAIGLFGAAFYAGRMLIN